VSAFVRSPGFVARHIAGELVLVPGAPRRAAGDQTADFFVLNESAEALWELLGEPRRPADLAQYLIETYELAPERARADVDAFLNEVRNIGAVREVDAQ
jgi:hypothetical protein